MTTEAPSAAGLYLIDKPAGETSFNLVRRLRRHFNIKKIGHAGTLDPFATGLMVMLVGRDFTRRSDEFLNCDKEYVAEAHFGVATDTYDLDGTSAFTSDVVPTLDQIKIALEKFQGTIQQIPPMFSAKKIDGKKLYDLARKGEVVERKAATVSLTTTLIEYAYPKLTFRVTCSKGTYIRSIAHELGEILECGAHLTALRRTRVGDFSIEGATPVDALPELKPQGLI